MLRQGRRSLTQVSSSPPSLESLACFTPSSAYLCCASERSAFSVPYLQLPSFGPRARSGTGFCCGVVALPARVVAHSEGGRLKDEQE